MTARGKSECCRVPPGREKPHPFRRQEGVAGYYGARYQAWHDGLVLRVFSVGANDSSLAIGLQTNDPEWQCVESNIKRLVHGAPFTGRALA